MRYLRDRRKWDALTRRTLAINLLHPVPHMIMKSDSKSPEHDVSVGRCSHIVALRTRAINLRHRHSEPAALRRWGRGITASVYGVPTREFATPPRRTTTKHNADEVTNDETIYFRVRFTQKQFNTPPKTIKLTLLCTKIVSSFRACPKPLRFDTKYSNHGKSGQRRVFRGVWIFVIISVWSWQLARHITKLGMVRITV